MAIQSPKNARVAPSEMVWNTISDITADYNLAYLLRTYIDRRYWMSELQKSFGVTNIDNLTDFNYARCFTYFISEPDLPLVAGDGGIRNYVTNHGILDRVEVLISTLGPYLTYKFVRYEYKDGEVVFGIGSPAEGWKRRIDDALLDFCTRNDLFVVSDADLQEKIEGIALELHGPNPSVFNLLFEDGIDDFPF